MTVIKCRINNLAARNIRREAAYQMVLIDLANAGAIDKRVAEALLGYEIPAYIDLPKSFEQLEALVNKSETEETETEEAEEETDAEAEEDVETEEETDAEAEEDVETEEEESEASVEVTAEEETEADD